MISWKIDQWYVRVEPDKGFRSWLGGEKTQEEQDKLICAKIVEQIRRHIDDVDSIELNNDGHYECSFCGGVCDDKDDYMCCDESVSEHEQAKMEEAKK